MRRRAFITLLGGALSVFLCESASAQEGYYGVGHDKWHQGFYTNFRRNDGHGSCCNLIDCRPTQSRMIGDHYEVKVDGEWVLVPNDKINNVVAPDGGAQSALRCRIARSKGVMFCVILPRGLALFIGDHLQMANCQRPGIRPADLLFLDLLDFREEVPEFGNTTSASAS